MRNHNFTNWYKVAAIVGWGWLAITVDAEAANSFTFGGREKLLYSTAFDSSFDISDWELGSTAVNNDVLQAAVNDWSRAYYNFNFQQSGYDLDRGKLNIYWSFKTDRTKNESSKVYLELNFTANRNDPNNPANIPFEEAHIAYNIRPALDNRPYQLYYDPAFCPDPNTCPLQDRDQNLQEAKPPTGFFINTSVFESFRLSARKVSDNILEFIPYYWSNDRWNKFIYSDPNNTRSVKLRLDTSLAPTDYYIGGLDTFKSLSFLFRGNVPGVDALAITRTRQPKTLGITSTPLNFAATTPESTSILGLLAIGLIVWQTRSTSKNSDDKGVFVGGVGITQPFDDR
jgi:hypothetical protein